MTTRTKTIVSKVYVAFFVKFTRVLFYSGIYGVTWQCCNPFVITSQTRNGSHEGGTSNFYSGTAVIARNVRRFLCPPGYLRGVTEPIFYHWQFAAY